MKESLIRASRGVNVAYERKANKRRDEPESLVGCVRIFMSFTLLLGNMMKIPFHHEVLALL